MFSFSANVSRPRRNTEARGSANRNPKAPNLRALAKKRPWEQTRHTVSMEAIFLIGMQGAGKSTFYRHTFFDTHLRINLDQLRTRNREEIMIRACLEAKMRFVWDNTNATRRERSRILQMTSVSGFRAFGYYFEPDYAASAKRNSERIGRAKVPLVALKSTVARLEKPNFDEGFEAIFSVWNRGEWGFQIEEWNREI